MTDEIIKLYENAGIKPTKNWQSCLNCNLKTEKLHDEWGEVYLTCMMLERPEACSDAKEFYPIFTAEKQLNLIIFLANREIRISPTYISSGYYLNNLNKIKSSRNISTFETSLAQHINAIWQDLTEEEKQQIKEILE